MPQRIEILGLPIDNLDLDTILDNIETRLKSPSAGQIITANSLMLNSASKDPMLAQIFAEAYFVLPESSGISWAASFCAQHLIGRIAGIDLMMQICQRAEKKGWAIYLLGGAEGVAEKAKQKLAARYSALKIVGQRSGFFTLSEEKALIDEIKQLRPQIVFVAMDTPRQEKWIYNQLKSFSHCLFMGVGGSFDVISGQLSRAPLIFQKSGLEWLYRLLRQPWRIGRILQLPIFVFRVAKYRLDCMQK